MKLSNAQLAALRRIEAAPNQILHTDGRLVKTGTLRSLEKVGLIRHWPGPDQWSGRYAALTDEGKELMTQTRRKVTYSATALTGWLNGNELRLKRGADATIRDQSSEKAIDLWLRKLPAQYLFAVVTRTTADEVQPTEDTRVYARCKRNVRGVMGESWSQVCAMPISALSFTDVLAGA